MSQRNRFIVCFAVTEALAFFSPCSEYFGYEFVFIAAAIGLAAVVLACVSIALAARLQSLREVLTAAVAFLAAPFVIGSLLALVGTPPNVHGLAILTFLLYAAVSIIGGVILLIVSAVRAKNERAIRNP